MPWYPHLLHSCFLQQLRKIIETFGGGAVLDLHPSKELILSQWDRNRWEAFLSVPPNAAVRSCALLNDKQRKDKGRPCTAALGQSLQGGTGASIPKMPGFWW